MAQAISARRDGDAFQARIFWLKAANLLDLDGRIVRVGFEHGPQGFDDVWIEYNRACRPLDQFGKPIDIERFQCKWHVSPGQYTYEDLARSEYINAKTSLLQRAQSARALDIAQGLHSRICLVTNHRVDPGDTLSRLIRTRSYTLHLDRLFDNSTDNSAVGKVRKLWREHLGIDNDELRTLCATIGLDSVYESLDNLKEQVDQKLRVNGLVRIESGTATRYDDLPFQWASQGRNVFNRQTFRQACEDEGLLADEPQHTIVFGVKSFQHAYDRLEDRCTDTLNLIGYFDERFIQEQKAWNQTLLPKLDAFIKAATRKISGPRIQLALDAHSTLAFAAGTLLNTKSGRLVELEQRSPHPVIWAHDDMPIDPQWSDWDFKVETISEAPDIVVGVSLTHSVETKVREHLTGNLPQVGTLVLAAPNSGPSQGSVICGAHANQLAEKLASYLKELRDNTSGTASPMIHIFLAAPNGFTLYFGRHVEIFKPITLYEFDFESKGNRSYTASLSIPS
ncbi:MAG TPA: SAVED domain-containing protein [Bacteroidetes bacterium]|nr:SAVED domain-containing protein [Bacteroidota bacterium]HEX03555.1 SAVED domain-containing protein [Bacteroidota bacterium]